MVLMWPGIDKNQTVNEMVELTDITSTILKWAGLPLPDFYDSEPLPGEGMSRQKGRDRIFGLLSDGWMNFHGRYKLHKYSSGEVFLFDISEDPDEQNNLANSLKHRKIVERLDRELTHKIMESVSFSMHDRLGQPGDMSQSDKFGLEGWSRPWPHPPHS